MALSDADVQKQVSKIIFYLLVMSFKKESINIYEPVRLLNADKIIELCRNGDDKAFENASAVLFLIATYRGHKTF